MNDTRSKVRGLIEAMKEQGDVIFGEVLPILNELESLRIEKQQAEGSQAALQAAQQRVGELEQSSAPLAQEIESLRADVARLTEELAAAATSAPAAGTAAPAADGIAPADLARQFAELQFQVETLDYAPGQVDIIKATLDGAVHFATRGALFIVKGAQAVAWSGTGFESDIRNRTVPLGAANGFALALGSLHWQHGAGATEPSISSFTRITPKAWAVFPILVRGKVAALLYADDGGGSKAFHAAPLLLLTRVAGLAIDGLKDREKRQPLAPEKVLTVLGGDSPAPAAAGASGESIFNLEMSPAPEPAVVAPPPPPPPPPPVFVPKPAPVVAAPLPPPPPPPLPAPVVAAAPEPEEESRTVAFTPAPAPVAAPPPPAPAPAPAPLAAAAVAGGDIPPEEKRLHDDARRYARVLAQEILLYNAQRVETGRKKNNIYGTLKDEIDKSREAYDRRFKQPQIQSRPYFHDALVQYLCEGNPGSLGI